jgi:hypothetical protein
MTQMGSAVESGHRRVAPLALVSCAPRPAGCTLPARWEREYVLWHTVSWRGGAQRDGRYIHRQGGGPAQAGLVILAPGVNSRQTFGAPWHHPSPKPAGT